MEETMDQFERQKQTRMAMNGRMYLLMAGIILIFSAITSSAMYGINMFMIASEAAKGTAEYIEALETVNMSVNMARLIGSCFVLLAAAEIFIGVFSIRLSNRVDKAAFMKRISLILLAAEVLMQLFLLFMGMLNPGMLLTSIAIPLFMLWGATRLTKLAKAEPDRIYAVDTKKNKGSKPFQAQQKAPEKKSLRERAMMHVDDEKEGAFAEEAQPDGGNTAAFSEAEKTSSEKAEALEQTE